VAGPVSAVRAVVCPRYGPPEIVRIEQRPRAPVAAGQARVRVAAAAVNFPDVLLLANRYQISVPTPFVPGSEFAGVVTELAEDVTGVAVGDRVTGTGIVGAFAEEVVVAAQALSVVPDEVDLHRAAAFGVAYRTAYHALRAVARIEPGHELIVLGAGGGVGLAAVELGTLLGARVTAVASSADKLAVARDYGAARTVDHRAEELRPALRAALPDGAHAALDPVGGNLAEPALRSLRRGGRFVTVGYASGVIPRIPLNLVLVKGVTIHGFQFQDVMAGAPDEFHRHDAELRELLASGRACPHIGAVYPANRAAEALRRVADGRAIGKVLITFD
jgi:NADPH2:quinone reductase